MKTTSLIGSLVLMVLTAGPQVPAHAQVAASDPIASPFHAGLRASYLRNYHQTNSLIVADCPECGTFSSGSGNGFEVQLFGEVPFNFYRRLDLTFGAGFIERGGGFGAATNELTILDPGTNNYVPLSRQNTFSATLGYIDLTGGLRITPLKKYPAYISAGFDADIPVGRSVTYKQTESILSPQGVVYPQNNSTTLTDGEGVIGGANTLFGITGSLTGAFLLLSAQFCRNRTQLARFLYQRGGCHSLE